MSNQERVYNIEELSVKKKEKLGKDLIDTGKAKFIDELVSVNTLKNNLQSTLQQFSSLAPKSKKDVKGLGNLTVVNLGIVPEAFTIGTAATPNSITAVDATGDLAIYKNADDIESQRIRYLAPNSSKENITVLRHFDLGLTSKLSCLSNGVYKESVGSAGEDVKWKPITFKGSLTNAVDFTVFSSRHFFANKDGGILMTGGKSLTSQDSTNETKVVLSNMKFQALALDGPNRTLFALDTTERGNNLLMFPLDDNLEFEFLGSNELETNVGDVLGKDRVKFLVINIETSENYYFNNIIIAPGNKTNVINSGQYEVILVGTPLENNNGEVNLFAGTIHYEGDENGFPTCVYKNGQVYATCEADTVGLWGLGGTFSEVSGVKIEDPYKGEVNIAKNIGNCNYAGRINGGKWGTCKVHSAPKLLLTKLVDENFSSKSYHNENEYNIQSPTYQMATKALDNRRENTLGSVDYKLRYIPLDINKVNNEIFVLLDGVLLRHPLYGLGSRTNIETYSDLINIPIDRIMSSIEKLSKQYDNINNTRNILDNKLIDDRNNKLFKNMDLVTEKLNKLKTVENEHKKLEGQISSGDKFVTSNSLQYIFWGILVIISILIIGLHFISPNLIPTWGVIIYIIICVIIVLVSRGIFTDVKNKLQTIL